MNRRMVRFADGEEWPEGHAALLLLSDSELEAAAVRVRPVVRKAVRKMTDKLAAHVEANKGFLDRLAR